MAQSPLAQLDNAFPRFNGTESVEQKIDQLTSYIYQQNEIIRYLLNHIDITNITEAAQRDLTEPVRIQINDVEQGLSTKIDIEAGKLSSEISDTNGNLSRLQQTTNNINATVANITIGEGNQAKVKTAMLDLVATADGSKVTLQGDKINLNGAVNVSDPNRSLAGSVRFGEYTFISSTAGAVSDLSLSTSGAICLMGSNGGLVLENDGELYGSNHAAVTGTEGRIYFEI